MTSIFGSTISYNYPKMYNQRNEWTSHFQPTETNNPWGWPGYQQDCYFQEDNGNEDVRNYVRNLNCYNDIEVKHFASLNGPIVDIEFPDDLSESNDSKKSVREDVESRGKQKKNGSVYKHVPHKNKPPQVVEKRNARERRRVQAVNKAFVKLRQAVPIENKRGKRISKVRTLHYAIEYIQILQKILETDDDNNTQCILRDEYKSSSYANRRQITCQNPYFEGFTPCVIP